MTNPNPFLQSPFDAIAQQEEDGVLPGQQAVKAAPKLDMPKASPAAKAPESDQPEPAVTTRRPAKSDNYLPPDDLVPLFESAAQKYDVPANVIMALAHQESRYNSRAIGEETQWGRAKGMLQYLDGTAKGLGINAFDPGQAIDGAAKQIRQRLDQGVSMIDAVKEHFAGPDRKLWGAKTEAYGREVMDKVGKIGDLLLGSAHAGEMPASSAADTDIPKDWVKLTPEQAAEYEAKQAAPSADAPAIKTGDKSFLDEYVLDPLKRGAQSMKQGFQASGAMYDARQLAAIGKIDKGEKVPDQDDALGYQYMNPAQRAAIKKTMGEAFTGAVKDTTETGKKIAAIPQDPIVAAASNAKSFDEWWKYFKQAPIKFIAQTGMESLPNMAPGLLLGAGAGLVAQGTMKAGGAIAGAAGMGAGSYAVDYPSTVMSVLQDMGIDTNNPDALAKAFSDPKVMKDVQQQAHAHASVVGALDAVSGGRAGATIVGGKAVARQAANLGAKTVEQGVLGAAGEAGGQVAQGKKELEWGAIMGEFAGEAAGAPVEIAGAAKLKALEALRARGADPVPAPAPMAAPSAPAPTPSQAAGPLSRSAENAAEQHAGQPQRVVVDTPQGAGAGTLTGYQEDHDGNFVAQIVGDDGQVHQVTSADGVQITPEAPADSGPLTASLSAAADAHAENPAPMPEQPAAPPAPPDYSSMPIEELRGSMKYIAEQAKASGGWNKRLIDERKKVEREINAKTAGAQADSKLAEEPLSAGPFDDMKAANKMALRSAESTGQPHEVIESKGKFKVQPITETSDARPDTAIPGMGDERAQGAQAAAQNGADQPGGRTADKKPGAKRQPAVLPGAPEPSAGAAVAGADTPADGQPALTQQERERLDDLNHVALPALKKRIASGYAPFIDVATQGDGSLVVSAKGVGSTDSKYNVSLELTAEEKKAVRRAQSNEELADTPEERKAAKRELHDAVAGAVARAVNNTPALESAREDANAGKWFGSKDKADAYLTKKKAAETHEVVQTGKVRWEVKPKAAPVAADIDATAHEAATSPTNDLPEPTQGQIEAGNYKKGTISLHGLDIAVENPRGSTRSGTDPDGKAWSHTMSDHYGYIRRTVGADDEQVDVYVGPKPESDRVFVVDQIDQPTGKFDEHKIMLGYSSRHHAVTAYKSNFDKGWKVGPVKQMSVDEFKAWLKDGDTSKPASDAQPANDKQAAAEAKHARQEEEVRKAAENIARRKAEKAAAEKVPDVAPAPASRGHETYVRINDRKVAAQWEVIEADDLEATIAKADNQYRDRTRAASQAQIGQIANAPAFDLLSDSPMMDYGAPTLARDGKTIIGGNGRFAGLVRAYAQGTAAEYQAELAANADRFGVNTEGMRQPVLVRRFSEDVNVKEAAIASNEGGGLKMSALEQAKVDAERMGDMADFMVGDNGEINSPGNARFIRGFMTKMPQNQQASFVDADGKLSQEGIVRIRNAVLFRAYGDTPTLARMVESADPGLRNIVTALLRVAPKIADAKSRIADGDLHDLDISDEVIAAVEQLNKLRTEGTTIDDYINQLGLFGDTVSDEVAAILRFMDANTRSAKAIADFIGGYYDAVLAVGSPKQDSMFGAEAVPNKQEIIDARAKRQAGTEKDQANIFADREAGGKAEGQPQGAGSAQDGDVQEQVEELSAAEVADASEPLPSNTTPIADFGEKLEGARKDVWASYADKMKEAGEADVAAVPLSKSWPEPDYQKLLDGGADPWVVAFIHAARDEVPTKPSTSWKLKGWVGKVELLRRFAGELLAGTITRERIEQELLRADYQGIRNELSGRVELYGAVGHGQSLKGVRVSGGSYSVYNGVPYNPARTIWTVSKEAKATAFSNWPRELASGDTREEAIANFKRKYAELELSPAAAKTIAFDLYSKRNVPGKVFIGKKVGKDYIDLKTFDSVADARKFKAENQAELERLLAGQKEIPNERNATNSPRVGVDHRSGADVTPEQFAEAFAFRGVQFGNYVEGGRRQSDLNEAYDALMDMAGVLGVPPRALSLNGQLGLSFGARGKGGKNAAKAHYERNQIVINLTKGEGAGSLGHEWFHSLDNYFSRGRNKKDEMTTEAKDVSLAARHSNYQMYPGMRRELVEAFGELIRTIDKTALKQRSEVLDKRRSKAYWSTTPEMAARAFESYLINKLADQGASNDYLSNIVSEENFSLEGGYPYPTAGELPAIRAAFDNLFSTIEVKDEGGKPVMYSVAGGDTLSAVDIAKALDTSRWLDRGIKLGKSAKIYRGVSERTGRNTANFGRGRYTTTDKREAAQYGEVLELGRESLPSNPIRFQDEGRFREWESFVAREVFGYRRMSEFEAAHGTPDQWVRLLDPAIDGIQIGTGHGAFFVQFPDTGTRYSVTNDSAATAIAKLMDDKAGEATINRPDIGDITVSYGDGKSGLSHIARRRGAGFMERLPALLRDGNVYEKPGQPDRIFIGNGQDEAVIRLDRDGETQNWLLSAYEKYPDLAPVSAKQSRIDEPQQAADFTVMSQEEVKAAITTGTIGPVIARMIEHGVIVIHKSARTLPQEGGKAPNGVQAVTMPDGTIHFVAGSLTQKNVRAVLLHEMFHKGAETLIGSTEWANLMGRMGSLYRQSEQSNGKAREFFDRARRRVAAAKEKAKAAGKPMAQRLEVEEFAAYAIEEYETNREGMPAALRKWVEDLIGLVKAYMVKRYGKQIGQVTPAQLSAFAKLAIMDVAAAKRGEMFGPIGELFSMADEADAAQRYSVAADIDAPADADATPEPDTALPEGLVLPPQGFWRKVQAAIQDNMNRVQEVQDHIEKLFGVPIRETADYRGAEKNRPGRIAARMEDGERFLFQPLIERLEKAGHTMKQLAELLHAMHAQERNEYVASINPKFDPASSQYEGGHGSGMSTDAANEIIRKYAGEGFASLHRLADAARAITKATLDLKLAYGTLTQERYDQLTTHYKNYVPLKGDGEYGPKIKRAMGHEEREEHILENITRDYKQAVVTGEKNHARMFFLRLVLQNPDPKLWTVGIPPRGRYIAGKVYTIERAGQVVATFASHAEVNGFLEAKGNEAAQYSVKDSAGEQVTEFAKPLQDNEVMVYVKGDPVRIQINGDETLARQLRPLDQQNMRWAVEKLGILNRYFSKIYTGYNPAFILRNAVRDAGTGTINMIGHYGALTAGKTWVKHYVPALAALGYWAQTGKVMTGIAGEMMTEYRMHGGKVGASHMGDLESTGKSLQLMYDTAHGAIGFAKDGRPVKASLVAGRKLIGKLAHVIEVANQATENALRLALYTELRSQGVTPGKAAQAAKGVTVDFDQKGTATGALGALYLFTNPKVQGTANAIRTMAHGEHKGQAWAAVGMLAMAGVYLAAKGHDDDKDRWLGEKWGIRSKNFILNFGSHQLRIPVSQEFAPAYAFGVAVAEARRGEKPMASSMRVMSSFLDAYFPLSNVYDPDSDNHGADLAMAAIPTALQLPTQLAFNRNSFGSQIVPESPQTKDRPDNLKMSRATKNTAYDKTAQALANGKVPVLNMSLGEMMGAGKYENDITKISPESLKAIWSTYTGGLGQFVADSASVTAMTAEDPHQVERGDVPIMKDFVRTRDVKPIRGRYYELSREAHKAITEFDMAKKAGDGEAMDLIFKDEDKARLVGLGRMVRATNKAAGAIRDEEVEINGDKHLSGAQKRAALKKVEQSEEELYRSAIGAFK